MNHKSRRCILTPDRIGQNMDKYTLKTVFEKSFLGQIWRIEVDENSKLLAIETRSIENGKPFFSALDYLSGECPIDELAYGDKLWTLAGICEDKLLLKSYSEKSPEGAGICCLSAVSGAILWEKFNYTFLSIDTTQVLVRPAQFRSGYEISLSIENGEPTSKKIPSTKPSVNRIVIPQPYNMVFPDYIIHHNPIGSLYHHQVGEKEIWAFHVKNNNKLDVKLLISQGFMMLAEQTIMCNLEKMTPEIFFMIGQQLFFIDSNKRKIVSYLV